MIKELEQLVRALGSGASGWLHPPRGRGYSYELELRATSAIGSPALRALRSAFKLPSAELSRLSMHFRREAIKGLEGEIAEMDSSQAEATKVTGRRDLARVPAGSAGGAC